MFYHVNEMLREVYGGIRTRDLQHKLI